MSRVLIKSFTPPPFSEKEALRYAGVRTAINAEAELLSSAFEEVSPLLSYKTCYIELCITISGDVCDFGLFKLKSRSLAKNLSGCSAAILFAATVGIGIDRLISKYSHISPSRAVMLDAIGVERIEALCDEFCKEFEGARPRFSPGYGDLALDAQRDIFNILDAPKHIGISLNESLIMSPAKSVTAIVGIKDEV